jgi:hypothetical protein
LNVLELMLDSEDTLLEELDNRLGSSMELARPLRLTITDPTHSKSPIKEDQPTLELLQPTQDGGRCSE